MATTAISASRSPVSPIISLLCSSGESLAYKPGSLLLAEIEDDAARMIWWNKQRPDLAVLNLQAENTLISLLGIEMIEVGDDWLRARMPVDSRTHQPFGRLHGGATVALAETVASIASSNCIDRERVGVVGMEINANHVRPAYAGWVYATARPESMGRTMQVWSIRIEDEAGKLVSIARMTAAVIDRARK
ncbi:MAG: hotdog fold thioesterase [Novosphingobium sp.]